MAERSECQSNEQATINACRHEKDMEYTRCESAIGYHLTGLAQPTPILSLLIFCSVKKGAIT